MALDYTTLQSAIADYLNRDDLTETQLGGFISSAEAQIWRDVRHWRMEKRADVPATDRYTALPADFQSVIHLHTQDTNKALVVVTSAELQDLRAEMDNTAGTPIYYAITGGEIELLPTPTDATLEMQYMQKIPTLSDAEPSNWLMEQAPDVYLYGSLAQTAMFLHDDQRLASWSSLYTNAVNGLKKASQRAVWGDQKPKMRLS